MQKVCFYTYFGNKKYTFCMFCEILTPFAHVFDKNYTFWTLLWHKKHILHDFGTKKQICAAKKHQSKTT